VIAAITADYERLDPAGAGYFASQRRAFETAGLARYDALREQIRAAYAGVPVGYSESIFQGLGEDLHLKLPTPYSFAKAIAEGGEVTAQDKRTVDEQAEQRRIRVWVLNSQNVTPDVRRVSEIARAKGIPIATVTETLSPASESFEQWQVAQLEGLQKALHEATGTRPMVAAVEMVRGAVRLGGRTIWSDVDLLVGEGEFVAILGPNGAGKSTLLNVLLGLNDLAAGSVAVLGGSAGRSNERIGYLPQRRCSTRPRGCAGGPRAPGA